MMYYGEKKEDGIAVDTKESLRQLNIVDLLNGNTNITLNEMDNKTISFKDMMVLPVKKMDPTTRSKSKLPYLIYKTYEFAGISNDGTSLKLEGILSKGQFEEWHETLLNTCDYGSMFVRYLMIIFDVDAEVSNKSSTYYNRNHYVMTDQLIKDTSASVGNHHTTVVARSDDDSAWNQVSSWGDDTEDIASILNDDVHERE
jgi:hypothetical protein